MHESGGAPPEGARLGLGLALVALLLWGLACQQGSSPQKDPVASSPADSGEPGPPPPPPPPADVFQPGFHMALRGSSSTGGLQTYRFAIPIGRAGDRLRIRIRAGEGPLRIARATVGLSDRGGRLKAAPVELTFGGSRGAQTSQARGLLVSDPVDLPVQFHDELYVSFAAEGALAASRIYLFPDSYTAAGDVAGAVAIPTGQPQTQLVGLNTIEVEGPQSRAFVAIGDSITEGYIEGGETRPDDYRNSWPFVAEGQLGLPVVNAAVSGQGVYEELNPETRLEEEVLSLDGVTDCVVLLGTNDLGAGSADIVKNLGTLFGRLAASCRVWAGTLPPKENGNVAGDRAAVNQWIRTNAPLHAYVELDPVLGNPPDFASWLPSLTVDGIHPTVEGSARIGRAFGAALAE